MTQKASSIDCSNMQCFGANFCRGHSTNDSSIVLEFGIANTGEQHDVTKISCSVLMTLQTAVQVAEVLQRVVQGRIQSEQDKQQ